MKINFIDTSPIGYKQITTYGIELSIADEYGLEETKKALEEIISKAKEDYKTLTELVLILSFKTIQHQDKKDYLDFYMDKYVELSKYAFDTLKGEELKYFILCLSLGGN